MVSRYSFFWAAALLWLFPALLRAQGAADCEVGSRYLSPIADEVTMTTVKYGENVTFNGNFTELFMDIYVPAGDTESQRATLVLAHGGAFITGTRADIAPICEAYARLGYVAVSISYRLYDGAIFPLPDSLDFVDVVAKAVGDTKAAVRYLKKSAAEGNPYGIDPDRIVLGGVSAGAVAALHAVYVGEDDVLPSYVQDAFDDNGGLAGNTDLPGQSAAAYDSEALGVLNYSGALYRAGWIDADDRPLLSVQGDADEIVPYGFGFANVCGTPVLCDIISMQGSLYLHAQAEAVGLHSILYTVPGGDHVGFYEDPTYSYAIEELSRQFTYELVCPQNVSSSPGTAPAADFALYPNPVRGELSVSLPAGEAGPFDLAVYNAQGQRLLWRADCRQGRERVDTGNWPAGLYVVQIRAADGGQRSQVLRVW